jgi:hypothetical protein
MHMANVPRTPGPTDEAPTPGWVYVVGIAAILLAGVFVGMHFVSGGVPQH